jgi:hypothetical protein
VLGTSPSSGQILAPGELVKNSGKFSKPTKIPGKNYSKDEIVIRNADSGKGEFFIQYFLFGKILSRPIQDRIFP